MKKNAKSRIPEILSLYEQELLAEWIQEQLVVATSRTNFIREPELRQQARGFLSGLREAVQGGNLTDIMDPVWAEVREILSELTRTRRQQGFTPSETAMFVLSLKQPLFARLQEIYAMDLNGLAGELWTTTTLLDQLALFTTEVYQKSREEMVTRQQEELFELSTPVVKLWEGILVLPLIGTLDSARTQVVMENLLQMIVQTGSAMAIIDITGVPTVDTLVAQHLLKTVAATRLMGADCIISGIRPQIAQTIVELGVDLSDVVTKASLADAFRLALHQVGLTVSRSQERS